MYCRARSFPLFAAIVGATFCLGQLRADTIEVRITDGNDDAEEHLTESNAMDIGSTDLELGAEGGGGDTQDIGIRFLNVNIPPLSTITNAWIQFTVDETDDEDTSVRIFGELSANPLAYADVAGNITARSRTTGFVDWNNIPIWDTEGAAGADQQTPSLTAIVQEIIDQPGWAANNALAFILAANPGGERTAESYNGAFNHGNLDLAPLLHVEFDPVPEPSTLILAALAALGLAYIRRR